VQEYGSWALRHLVLDPECKAIALREGAAQAIRQGMQEYPNRAGVQDQVPPHTHPCTNRTRLVSPRTNRTRLVSPRIRY